MPKSDSWNMAWSHSMIHQFLELLLDCQANPLYQGIPHVLVHLLKANVFLNGRLPQLDEGF